MKKTVRFAAVLLVFACCLSLASCGLLGLQVVDGKLYDKKNDITYYPAPVCYEPSMLAEKPFAKCSSWKIELYEVVGQSTAEIISETYSGIGGLYYAADKVTLPDLREFDANLLTICVEDVITVGLGQVDVKADINAVIDAFLDGEPCAIVQSGDSYKLKFSSDKYEGIYYTLLYVEGTDGENYIYDRSTQTCVNVGDVLLTYMPRD